MAPVVLDISRSVARASKGRVTGIDRVELAYISYFLDWPEPVFFLARFRSQYGILDRQGMRALLDLLMHGGPWSGRKNRTGIKNIAREVRASVRNLSILWSRFGLAIDKVVPRGHTYVNVGHGRMIPTLWPRLRAAGAAKIIVMVHDVIPLDFPQFCRPETTKSFGAQIRALTAHADVLLCNSAFTERALRVWLGRWGHDHAQTRVVALGADPLPVSAGVGPQDAPPYFVVLGTIEPRKNHRLLLDIWRSLPEIMPDGQIPHLHIIGARGWQNEDVFSILDSAGFMGKTVFEVGALSDLASGNLIQGARALLFPSYVEGFGYPLVEALYLNTPVVCSDIACFHEVGQDAATYIDPENIEKWRDKVVEMTQSPKKLVNTSHIPASWGQHFHNVATIVSDM